MQNLQFFVFMKYYKLKIHENLFQETYLKKEHKERKHIQTKVNFYFLKIHSIRRKSS